MNVIRQSVDNGFINWNIVNKTLPQLAAMNFFTFNFLLRFIINSLC